MNQIIGLYNQINIKTKNHENALLEKNDKNHQTVGKVRE